MRRQSVGWGVGIIVAVLISLALLLFNVVSGANAVAALLLLVGLWTLVFGAAFTTARDRLYFVGWGLVIAVLSTFAFLPLQYTAGLVVVVILIVVLASVFWKPGSKAPPPPGQGSATMS